MSYDKETTEALAAELLSTLYTAESNDEHLARSLQDTVHATGWYPDLAATLLARLESALEAGAHMGQVIKDAYERAAAEIGEFAKKHPIIMKMFYTAVALWVLAMLVPLALEVLGFGTLGPIEGMPVVMSWRMVQGLG